MLQGALPQYQHFQVHRSRDDPDLRCSEPIPQDRWEEVQTLFTQAESTMDAYLPEEMMILCKSFDIIDVVAQRLALSRVQGPVPLGEVGGPLYLFIRVTSIGC